MNRVTRLQIKALRDEAGQVNDVAMVSVCNDALAGGTKAYLECADVIEYAQRLSVFAAGSEERCSACNATAVWSLQDGTLACVNCVHLIAETVKCL